MTLGWQHKQMIAPHKVVPCTQDPPLFAKHTPLFWIHGPLVPATQFPQMGANRLLRLMSAAVASYANHEEIFKYSH